MSETTPANTAATGANPPTEPDNAAQDANVPLEPDDVIDDRDSAVGTIDGSENTSVRSSVYKFRVENGRTYHSYKQERAYPLPNDERENDRLDLVHNACIVTMDGRLHLAPIGDNFKGRVLDAGTGTGVWAIAFADDNPEAQIVGTDLSPIQPSSTPPNVEFFIDDLEEDWNFHTKLDFVYMRMLLGAIKNWPRLMEQAFENLNPGGYIELLDSAHPISSDDDSIPKDSALLKWSTLSLEASRKYGSPTDIAFSHKQRLIDAGFVNVVEKQYKWPINAWPKDPKMKELGLWSHEISTSGLQAMSLAFFTGLLGWTVEEVEVFLIDVRKDLKNPRIHAYWPVRVVYGQKPE